MDAKTFRAKRCCIVEEDMDDDIEEEEEGSGGSFVDDEKKKGGGVVVYGKRGTSGGGSGSGGAASPPSCQVEKCGVDLSDAKRYHRRHKVCDVHAKAPAAVVSGLRQRFCQQCSRFHELSEFDEAKRSCRRRLAGHNERRRKNSSADQSYGESSSRNGKGLSFGAHQLKESQCRQHDDQRGKYQTSIPGNSTYKRSETRYIN